MIQLDKNLSTLLWTQCLFCFEQETDRQQSSWGSLQQEWVCDSDQTQTY